MPLTLAEKGPLRMNPKTFATAVPTDHCCDDAAVPPDFVEVKIRSLFPGSVLPCDFYFPSIFESEEGIQQDKVLSRGEQYGEEDHRTFMEDGVDSLYVRLEDESEFLSYLNTQTLLTIGSALTPNARKTQLLYDNAELVVKKVFREHPNEENIQMGKQLIEQFAAHLSSGESTLTALLSLFSKDYYTFNHCIQVAALGMSFCGFLGWSSVEMVDVGLGTLFHDVGKNSISENILNKPGKLESHEYHAIRQHPFLGYQQLKKSRTLSKDQLYTVLYHHEAMDGTGYPDALAGNDIPLYARLAHIVDVFDALTSERAYKKALPWQDTLALMRNEARSSFDGELLDAFTRFIEDNYGSLGLRECDIKAVIGTPFSLQCESSDKKMRSILVGMEQKDYFVLRLSDPAQLQDLKTGTSLTVRYVYAGEAYGFKSTILVTIPQPFPLILLAYPGDVERLSLRSERRHACLLPAGIECGEETVRCLMVNLSYRGCRVSMKNSEKEKLPSLDKDDFIKVWTYLPGRDEAVRLRGQVRNVEKTEEEKFIGVMFTAEQAADQWKAFINDILELTR